MQKHTGIWIDHREAVIVTIDGEALSVEHLRSGVESHYRASGGWKAGGSVVAQSVAREQRAENRQGQQLDRFFGNVVERVCEADCIVVFGPGEAKGQLAKAIKEHKALAERLRAVEPADKMSENQFVAKVRAFYGMQEKRLLP